MRREWCLRYSLMLLMVLGLLILPSKPTWAGHDPLGIGESQATQRGEDQTTSSASLAVPEGPLFLVPNDIAEVNASNSTPIHDYGPNRLMLIPRIASLPAAVRNRITALDDTTTIGFRGWKGSVPRISDGTVSGLPDAYYLVALVGPPDEFWRQRFSSFGVTVVDVASPYGLVVHASGKQLLGAVLSISTSYGYSAVRGVLPIPLETRLSGELLRIVRGQQRLGDIPGLRKDGNGSAVARLFYYNDPIADQKPLDHRAAQLAEARKYTRTPSTDLAYGYDDAVLISGPEELLHILNNVPSVEYIEAIHERRTDDHAQVYYPIAMAVSPPLYTLKPRVPEAGTIPKVMPEEKIPWWVNGKGNPAPAGTLPESAVLQDWIGTPSIPSPLANFEGLGSGLAGFTMTGAPPDTEGDVGPSHYVQWVNSMFAIFDKGTGAVLYGPANGSTLFTPLGGRCSTDNSGDPLVMYDKIADRWFMSQFAVSVSPYYQCIAVSQTNNPVTSPWNLYAFSYGTNFNDYGKSGVWPDGYYIMYHMFAGGTTWAGTQVCAFDRVKMLAGLVATQQCFGPNTSYGGLLPSHLQGSTLPPAGSPNYFMAYGSSGQLLFWPFHVDWTTPASTTFPFSTPTTLAVAAFTQPCGGTGGTCVPQSGTTTQLDTLGDRLMWRMNYRNFGTYESLVFNHSITGGAGTGVRWYEIRTPSTTPTVYQQGTFAPAGTTWRWMGSVNMDKDGDIAAGYSGSSSTLNPSLMYTGRLVTDPLGTLPQGEATLFAGTGSQTGTLTRWGDYSTMSIDPADDCTFWFTSEYLTASGTFNWHTRIGSFKFPSCVTCTIPGVPAIGTVTVPGLNQLQVSWTAGVPAGATYKIYRALGACPGGAYSLLASGVAASPYTDNTVSGTVTYSYKVSAVDSTGGCESAQSGCASGTATGTCNGAPTFVGITSVTNPALAICTLNLGWAAATPLCAGPVTYKVFRGTGAAPVPPAGLIASGVAGLTYTDNVAIANGATYFYIVHAVDTSNGAEDTNVVAMSGVPTGPITTGTWSDDGGDTGLAKLTVQPTWTNAATGGRTGVKCYATGTYAASACISATTPAINVATGGGTLTFWSHYDLETGWDKGQVELSTDGGTTFNRLAITTYPAATTNTGDACGFTGTAPNNTYFTGASAPYASYTGTIPAGAAIQVRWRLSSDASVAGTGWWIDDITITNVQVPGTCATGTGCTTPGAPAIGTATVPGLNQISVPWTAGTPAGATYKIYRSTGACPGGAFSLLASGETSSPYLDTTVSGGTTYSYKVSAVDSTGGCESLQSGCASATATGPCTLAPTFGGVASVTNAGNATCRLNLGWTAGTSNCAGTVSYNIYRSATTPFTPAPANRIATAVTGITYSDTSALANGTPYYYIVRAVDSVSGEDANTVTMSGVPTGPTTTSTLTDTFEGANSGGGFDLAGWTHNAIGGAVDWAWSTLGNPQTPAHDWFSASQATATDRVLTSPSFGVLALTTMTFYHTYAFEGTVSTCYDGGTLEVTTNGGTTWTVVPDADITVGGFTGTVNTLYANPIGGKRAWCAGTVGAMTQVSVNLGGDANLVNRTVKVRWHAGDDSSTSVTGWYVDSVVIANAQTTATCATGGAVKPVPDGKWITGTPAKASKNIGDGSSLALTWDVATCADTNYNLYYGNGSQVSSYALTGSACALGNTGNATWNPAPAVPGGEKFLWWVIAGTDGVQTESSWGKNSAGAERHPAASAQCGFTAKSTAATCP